MRNESTTDQAGEPVNPYAASNLRESAPTNQAGLTIASWIAILCCLTSLALLLFALIVSLPYGHPDAPPTVEVVSFIGMFMVSPVLGLVGAISTLKRTRYRLAIVGACTLLFPLWGPCFGLTLPLGIWLVVLLRRPDVLASFAPAEKQSPVYENADDAMAAAFQLDMRGDWDAAVELYQVAASRWPQHGPYIANCIAAIRQKQSAMA
jgi:hypothetical protein